MATRTEKDFLGEKQIPADAYYGVQTLRGKENFHITGIPMSLEPYFVKAFGYVKKAAALANREPMAAAGTVAHAAGVGGGIGRLTADLAAYDGVLEIRRIGTMTGIEVRSVTERTGMAVTAAARARGVLIRRLRLADGERMALETLHVPAALVPGLTREALEDASFYDLMEQRYGVVISSGQQSIEPTVNGDFNGGFYTPSDSTGDIHKFTFGLAKACERRGARFVFDANVDRIARDGVFCIGYTTDCADGQPDYRVVEADGSVICPGSGRRHFARAPSGHAVPAGRRHRPHRAGTQGASSARQQVEDHPHRRRRGHGRKAQPGASQRPLPVEHVARA